MGALVSGGCGFVANPSKAVKSALAVTTGFFSVYAMTALRHDVSWQTAFFLLPVLCLWIACGIHVCAWIRRRPLSNHWGRTAVTASAAIMLVSFAAVGMPLIMALIAAGPVVFLAGAYWLKSRL